MARPFDGRRERERDQGKGRQNGVGSLGHRFEGLAGGVFLRGRRSASSISFNPHPKPWSRPRNQHGFRMGKPRLAELKLFAQDHLSCKCRSWGLRICTQICPSFGSH